LKLEATMGKQSHNGSAKTRAPTWQKALITTLLLVVAPSCLEEEATPGAPGGGVDPETGGQGGAPAFDPAQPTGLFGHNGYYMYLWPNGRFVLDKPVAVNGTFDEQATTNFYNTWLLGQIVSTTMVKPGVFQFNSRLDDGQVMTNYARASGEVNFPINLYGPRFGSHQTDWYFPARPVGVSSLTGVYADKWSVSSTSDPRGGSTGVDIYTGGATRFEFMPGNRVLIRYKSYVSTNVVVGTPGGGSTGTNRGELSQINIDGAGSYEIDGQYMTVEFDSGDVLTDFLYIHKLSVGTQLVFGNIYGYLQK
jgi:hypothetical protein